MAISFAFFLKSFKNLKSHNPLDPTTYGWDSFNTSKILSRGNVMYISNVRGETVRKGSLLVLV